MISTLKYALRFLYDFGKWPLGPLRRHWSITRYRYLVSVSQINWKLWKFISLSYIFLEIWSNKVTVKFLILFSIHFTLFLLPSPPLPFPTLLLHPPAPLLTSHPYPTLPSPTRPYPLPYPFSHLLPSPPLPSPGLPSPTLPIPYPPTSPLPPSPPLIPPTLKGQSIACQNHIAIYCDI